MLFDLYLQILGVGANSKSHNERHKLLTFYLPLESKSSLLSQEERVLISVVVGNVLNSVRVCKRDNKKQMM